MTALSPEQYRALADLGALDFRFHMNDVRDALRTAADQLEAVQEALARHPKCDKYNDNDVASCGWKSAVRDITWALTTIPAEEADRG